MKRSIFVMFFLMGLSLLVNSQDQQFKSITGTFIRATALKASYHVIFTNESGKEISFAINPDYKIDGKNIIKSNSQPADIDTPGLASDHGSVANPEFINKKMTVTYKMITGSKEGKIIDLELISSETEHSEFGTLMVIVGLYETQDEATNAQKLFLSNYQLETEVLSTNLFQNLEKDHYVVVTGRNLNYDEGQQLMENIKAIKVSGYIKDAGTMKLK
jgi:predicted Ser/Thr protein kinase